MSREIAKGKESADPAFTGANQHFFLAANRIKVGERLLRLGIVHRIKTQTPENIDPACKLQATDAKGTFVVVEHWDRLFEAGAAIQFRFAPLTGPSEMLWFHEQDIGTNHDESEEGNVHRVFNAEMEKDAGEENPVAEFLDPDERAQRKFNQERRPTPELDGPDMLENVGYGKAPELRYARGIVDCSSGEPHYAHRLPDKRVDI